MGKAPELCHSIHIILKNVPNIFKSFLETIENLILIACWLWNYSHITLIITYDTYLSWARCESYMSSGMLMWWADFLSLCHKYGVTWSMPLVYFDFVASNLHYVCWRAYEGLLSLLNNFFSVRINISIIPTMFYMFINNFF